MSIEALIKAQTEALLENTAAVKNLTLSLAGRSVTAANKAADAVDPVKPKAEVKTEVKQEPKVEAKTEVKTEVKQEPKIDAATPYETVRALVLKLAPTQRDAIKALNAKHGIANLKVLLDKEDDFSTVNDQAKLEAVYADLQALEG
ncbi:hypothetical protein [Pseudomonas tolaasii]